MREKERGGERERVRKGERSYKESLLFDRNRRASLPGVSTDARVAEERGEEEGRGRGKGGE